MTSALLRRLGVFRRRATLMTLGSTAAVTAVGAAGASVLLARVLGWPAAFIACLTGALVVTTLATLAGVRSLRSLAVEIDGRSQLSDRVVTALEQRDAADPMGRLLLRDALERLEKLTPGDVFPFRLPRHFGNVVTAALVAAILGLAAPASLFPARQTPTAEGASVSGSPATSTASAAGPDETDVNKNREAQEAAQARATRSPAAAAKAPGPARDPSPLAPSAPTPANPVRDTPAPAGPDARTGQLTSRGSDPAPSAQTTKMAGGVSGSGRDLRARGLRGRDPSVVSRTLSLDAAGSAVAQQRLPPGLRAYVRTYFEAIRK